MFSDLLFFRSPIAPVPTASKHPEGLDFPTPDMGTEGRLSQIRAKACLASYLAADKRGQADKNRTCCHSPGTGPLLFLGRSQSSSLRSSVSF